MDNKVNDEELQNMIFEATSGNANLMDKESSDYYRILKTALATMPQTTLPENFADRVTKKAVQKKYLSDLLKSVALYLGLSTVFVTATSFALFFLAKDVFYFLIEGAQTYKYPIAFGLLVFVLIQFLDELLIRKKLFNLKVD